MTTEIARQVVEAVVRMSIPEYCERYLKIRTKEHGIQPFRLNIGQIYVHRKAELQKQRLGYVRQTILKARQWGGSTYVQGRFYSQIARGAEGVRAFILTHSADATRNVFDMTRRFYLRQDPRLRPAARLSQNILSFPRTDSSYAVATAGSEEVGRSDTIQRFHGSEVAYWPKAEGHLKGALQAVPFQGQDSEIWLESTGHGTGNAFQINFAHARAGLSDFEALFVPWFWFDQYQAPVTNLELTADDEEYAEFWGLEDEQLQFRYSKIMEFGGGEAGRGRFMSEYPATPEEAFSAPIVGGYIQVKYVLRARRMQAWSVQPRGPRIMGLDPADTGEDRFIVFMRQGRLAWRVGRWKGKPISQTVPLLAKLIAEQKPDIICVDIGGTPGGRVYENVLALVRSQKLPILIVPVMGGEAADDPDRWPRKSMENWGRMREWFEEPLAPCIIDSVPSDPEEPDRGVEEIQGDITNPLTDWDNKGRPVRETKKRLLSHAPSPDNGDALANTFTLQVSDDWKPPAMGEEYERKPAPNWRAI